MGPVSHNRFELSDRRMGLIHGCQRYQQAEKGRTGTCRAWADAGGKAPHGNPGRAKKVRGSRVRLSNCSDGHGLQEVAQQSDRDVANACLILETSARFESAVRIHRIDRLRQLL